MGLWHELTGAEVVKAESYNAPQATDTRLGIFADYAQMPDDPTDVVEVEALMWINDNFSPSARRLLFTWDGGPNVSGDPAAAVGARVTVNAASPAEAAERLALTGGTGGMTTSSGTASTYMLSPNNPAIAVDFDNPIITVYAIGLPLAGRSPSVSNAGMLQVTAVG